MSNKVHPFIVVLNRNTHFDGYMYIELYLHLDEYVYTYPVLAYLLERGLALYEYEGYVTRGFCVRLSSICVINSHG